nr:MAG TPA: hypothetical protein [Bacteriophage sp.]DAU86407.1 MAG TPA: hypothetical protein [Caudoviricetes sp.]
MQDFRKKKLNEATSLVGKAIVGKARVGQN